MSKNELVSEEAGCRCLNPVVPVTPAWIDKWTNTTNQNIDLVNKAIVRPIQLDVVFLGDSITEQWNGRDSGTPGEKYHNTSVVFDELFHKSQGGGSLEGLALGVAGDRVSPFFVNDHVGDEFESNPFRI